MNPFHLAIPVSDLTKAINFYENTLGCSKGRSSALWSDFNFYGHQLVCHKVQQTQGINSNYVDGEDIPVPHFGIILQWDEFQELSTSLINKNIN